MFNTRTTNSGIRYVWAQVNGIYGVVLLPDSWSVETYTLNDANNVGNYNSNIITEEEWIDILEANGAVFLPAAGYRDGVTVIETGNHFEYWSTSAYIGDNGLVYYMSSTSSTLSGCNGRFYGLSVRLVCPVEN